MLHNVEAPDETQTEKDSSAHDDQLLDAAQQEYLYASMLTWLYICCVRLIPRTEYTAISSR